MIMIMYENVPEYEKQTYPLGACFIALEKIYCACCLSLERYGSDFNVSFTLSVLFAEKVVTTQFVLTA